MRIENNTQYKEIQDQMKQLTSEITKLKPKEIGVELF